MIKWQTHPAEARVPDDRVGPVARYDDEHQVLWVADTPIPFRRGGNNTDLLQLLGSTIRNLRGLSPDEPCVLRRSEYQLLADLLDLDELDLRFDLRTHLGLSRRQAGDVAAELRSVREGHVILDEELTLD